MRLRFRSQSTYLFSSQPQRGANLAAIWNVNLAPLVAATAAGAISTAINDVALPRPPPYALGAMLTAPRFRRLPPPHSSSLRRTRADFLPECQDILTFSPGRLTSREGQRPFLPNG